MQPTRRQFATMLGASAAAMALGRRAASAEPTRPNLVFLLTDDQRARTLGAGGHPVIQTPHLDRLAAGGVRFANAFVTDPTCMPSRVTFFSGVYERVHGIGFSSRNTLTEKQWQSTYPAILRRAGYHVGFIGKLGLERYAFRGKAKAKFDFWRGHDGWAAFFPKRKRNCAIYTDAHDDIITPIMGESVERFLDTAPQSKPFCLSVSFSAPHGSISGSMVPGESGDARMRTPANTVPRLKDHPIYGSPYRDARVDIPAATATDPSPHIPTRVLPQAKRRKCYPYDYTRPQCLEHHVRYYQLITGIDKVVGQLRASLQRRGLAANTVILFTSDHGLLMGEYGMGGKALLYDLATRIPFLVHDPRLPAARRGTALDAFVLSADVAPTLLGYAGIPAPAWMQGRDLRPLLADPAIPWRDHVFLENLYTGRDNPLIEAVRTRDWKYARYFACPGATYREADVDFAGKAPIFEQLFDLRSDPAETKNLLGDPQHAATLAGLRRRCAQHSADQIRRRRALRSSQV